MPEMTAAESRMCRSATWQRFTSRRVLPWALQGVELSGDVLEIGCGSGAMAAGLLERFPGVRLVATDVDPAMVASARERLAPFGERAVVQEADTTALPFADGEFDAVCSFIMLHHVIRWEEALAEVTRVLKPGGLLVGYDVLATGPMRWLHAIERSSHRLMRVRELRARVRDLPVRQAVLTRSGAGSVVRFVVEKAA
jgi:ubiquinone/menaquinone biosynthesis C-methylase UbiE